MCVCVCPRVHDAVCGLHLSLCAIWSQSVVAVPHPPHPPAIPLLAPLKWQFVKHGPLLALSFASQPFPARLLPPSSVLPLFFSHHSFYTLPSLSFPYLLSTLHRPLSPPLPPCLCPFVILPPLPSTYDLHSFVISLLFCISPYGLSIWTCRCSHSKIFTLNCKLKDWSFVLVLFSRGKGWEESICVFFKALPLKVKRNDLQTSLRGSKYSACSYLNWTLQEKSTSCPCAYESDPGEKKSVIWDFNIPVQIFFCIFLPCFFFFFCTASKKQFFSF